jgi:hypothetical protein
MITLSNKADVKLRAAMAAIYQRLDLPADARLIVELPKAPGDAPIALDLGCPQDWAGGPDAVLPAPGLDARCLELAA